MSAGHMGGALTRWRLGSGRTIAVAGLSTRIGSMNAGRLDRAPAVGGPGRGSDVVRAAHIDTASVGVGLGKVDLASVGVGLGKVDPASVGVGFREVGPASVGVGFRKIDPAPLGSELGKGVQS
ncbi:hypothetical protein OHB14_52705 [Streptomyces sp. NBC_01613]|uniref:hypothetical protein n=1 Tax=Streptomyces sp. NBC_01613 TaxID=2975896 RepID=UPI003865B981